MANDEGRESLREAAGEAARRAGARLIERLNVERQIEFKGGIDLVTDADRAAESEIVSFLRERFPDHALLTEESGAHRGGARIRWIVDPLDGTTNYAHRVPHFCVSIAAEQQGEGLVAGAVYDPVRDELFDAALGMGARLNGAPIRVTAASELRQALVSTGFPYNVWSEPDLPLALFDAFVRRTQGVRRAGSAALDLSYVASGRYDAFFEVGLKPWDIAAGTLLVREAGGIVTDLSKAPLDLDRGDILASNPPLHEPVADLIRQTRHALRARQR